jgi:hypothetical protein
LTPVSPLEEDRRRAVVCDEAIELCRSRLSDAPFHELTAWLSANGVEPAACARVIGAVTETPATHAPIHSLRTRLADAGFAVPDGTLERCLLLHAATIALSRMAASPVPAAVTRHLRDEIAFIADPAEAPATFFTAGANRFAALCKLVSLRRFPAGQFHWEVDGIARRDLFSVSAQRLAGAVMFAATRMGGLQPVFFSHLNARRERKSLNEEDACRSYHLMARTMELQPEIRGFAACSWFRAPATHAVSPHLAWLSRVFLENGGFVADAGRAAADCGVFYRSATRQQRYHEGRFTPRRGLVMWPRARMIAWAATHPEYGE